MSQVSPIAPATTPRLVIRRRPATVGILIGIFLAAIEATVVGTAMPTVVSDLGGVELYFLPISIYMIAATVMVPIFGRLSDLYGRRVFHFAGILLFLVGSVLCAFSTSMPALVLFRGIQGIGAGALMPLSFTMIADLYPLEQRARMQGAISGVWGVAALVGPSAGGLITHALGWRWVFLVNVPFGLLSMAIVRLTWKDPPRQRRSASLDIPGAMLLMLASASLMAAFGLAGQGSAWTAPEVLTLLAASVGWLALMAAVERRAKDPFLSYGLYRRRIFWTANLCGAFAAIMLFCVTSYLPLFIQSVIGGTPKDAGLVLTPMMMTWVAISTMSGFLLLRFGYRKLSIAGTALCAVAFALLGRMEAATTWSEAATAVTFLGAGLGCVMAPLLIAAQSSVSQEKLGAATSLTQFSRTMAGALGVAVMGTLMSSALNLRLAERSDLGTVDAVVHPLKRQRLSPERADTLRHIMADALHPVFLTGLAAAILGFGSALLLPAGRARDLARPADSTPDA
ncbi:MAG: MFS transporter [Planctomycetes bacterium]|nr:MFS transporter [Planctomycetota bacterium]